jgi:hypothetical protein
MTSKRVELMMKVAMLTTIVCTSLWASLKVIWGPG